MDTQNQQHLTDIYMYLVTRVVAMDTHKSQPTTFNRYNHVLGYKSCCHGYSEPTTFNRYIHVLDNK